jgi:hypothetical protein
MSPQADHAQVAQGLIYVRIAAAALLVTSIVTVVMYVVRLGTAQLPQQLVRIGLTAALGYALQRGHRWARWITVLLLFAGMTAVLGLFGDPEAFSRKKLPGTLGILAMFVTYGIIARGLLHSESVRAFFRAARASAVASSPSDHDA